MSLLLHISDPHFGTEQAPVIEALVRLVREQTPDVLVLSGDITQRARRRQFEAARQFVERLAVPKLLALPGNHDIPLNLFSRFVRPYANYQRAFGDNLEPELDSADLLILGVNTTRPMRHVDGKLSNAQIERVAQRLRRARPQQLRIVITHQPMHVYRPRDEHNLLHQHEAAARAWSAAGADLVLGGHIHLPYVRPLSDRIADLPRQVWCVQAGTSVSSRVRREAPNSIYLIRYPAAATSLRCDVERWDHAAAAARFEKVEVSTLTLDRP